MANKPFRSMPTDHWWIVALVASLAATVQFLIVWFAPESPGVWALAIGLLAFISVMWLNPTYWYRRMSATTLCLAGLSAAIPSINAHLNLVDAGTVLIIVENTPYLTPFFVIAGGFLAYLDYKSQSDRTLPPKEVKSPPIERDTITITGNYSPGKVAGDYTIHGEQKTSGAYSPIVHGNYTIQVTQQLLQQAADKAKKSWRPLMTIEYPAFEDTKETQRNFFWHLVGALEKTFTGCKYIEFQTLFRKTTVKVGEQDRIVYEMLGHQIEFLSAASDSFWSVLNQGLPLAEKQKNQDMLNERFQRLINTGWTLAPYLTFDATWLPLKSIYDAQSKTITFTTQQELSTEPATYPTKLTTTGDLLWFLASLYRSPIAYLGDITFFETNYPLTKLQIALMDEKGDLEAIRINADDFEEWDYVNTEFEEELRKKARITHEDQQ